MIKSSIIGYCSTHWASYMYMTGFYKFFIFVGSKNPCHRKSWVEDPNINVQLEKVNNLKSQVLIRVMHSYFGGIKKIEILVKTCLRIIRKKDTESYETRRNGLLDSDTGSCFTTTRYVVLFLKAFYIGQKATS